MSEPSRNFMVGMFVVISLAVLAVLLVWFGEAPSWLGGNEWTLKIVGVRQLRGVEPGSPVRLNGVEIGRVHYIDFADRARPDSGVVIFAGIREEYMVPGEAQARVYGATLGFGTGHIDIVVPSGVPHRPLPKEGYPMIEGEMRETISEIIPKETLENVAEAFVNIGEFAEAATPAAQNLGALLEPRRPADAEPGQEGEIANLSTVVQHFDELVTNMTTLVGDPEVHEDVRAAVREMRGAVTELREGVEAFRTSTERIAHSVESGVGSVTADLDESFVHLNAVLERLDNSASNLARTMQYIAEGRGTLGLLAKDPRLYEAAVLSLERFAAAMASLQVILGNIEREGYIPVGSSSGLIRKRIPVPGQSAAPE